MSNNMTALPRDIHFGSIHVKEVETECGDIYYVFEDTVTERWIRLPESSIETTSDLESYAKDFEYYYDALVGQEMND